MFVDSYISFFIAINVVVLTSNIIIFSLVNLRKQVETDYEDTTKDLEEDEEIDDRNIEDLKIKVTKDLRTIKRKIKNIGRFSLSNIYLIFLTFFLIFLIFFYKNIFLNYLLIILIFLSLVLFFIILHLFKSVYDFDPKEKIRRWKLHHRKKIKRDKYSSLSGAFITEIN